MGFVGPTVNTLDGQFQEEQVLKLYNRLFPLIARDFRHLLDCDVAMASISAIMGTHVHFVSSILAPTAPAGISPGVVPPYAGGVVAPLGSAAESLIIVSAAVPPYETRVSDIISLPPLQLPPGVPEVPGGA